MNEIEIIISSNPGISEEIIHQIISENEKRHFYCSYNNRVVLNKVTEFFLKEKGFYSKQDIEYTDHSSYFIITRWYLG